MTKYIFNYLTRTLHCGGCGRLCGRLFGCGCPRDEESKRIDCFLLGGPPARRGFSDPRFEQGHDSEYDLVERHKMI